MPSPDGPETTVTWFLKSGVDIRATRSVAAPSLSWVLVANQ